MSVRKRKWITRRGDAKEAWVADITSPSRRSPRAEDVSLKKKDADAFAGAAQRRGARGHARRRER